MFWLWYIVIWPILNRGATDALTMISELMEERKYPLIVSELEEGV